MPDALAMFIPLAKADATTRTVSGFFTERKDRAGETFDYEESKPLIKAWSDAQFEASGGKSYGNVRGQHSGNIAAGKLVDIVFDDMAKTVMFSAKIIDNNEWEKVEEGVYTGFSPGGKYAKRWQVGLEKRYAAGVQELSIVDVPCNPDATFLLTKADGTEAEVEFLLAKAYEPGNDATKLRSEDLAKAAGGGALAKNFVVQARADLISENATAELAKMAAAEPEAVIEPAPAAAVTGSDALADLLAKADTALAAPVAAPAEASDAETMAKGLAEIVTARTVEGEPMEKGLRGINALSSAIYQVVAVQASIAREAESEGDNSPVPAQVVEGIKTLCDALCAMAQEEVAELLADIAETGFETEAWDYSSYRCAAPILDMVKADTVLMEKAGARNNKGDKAKIQSMHDNSVALGATCDAASAKADLAAENERLEKAVGDSLPRITGLIEKVGTLTAENADLTGKLAKALDQPAPPKGGVFVVSKENDNGGPAAPDAPLAKSDLEAIAEMPNGMAKADAILRRVGTVPLTSL